MGLSFILWKGRAGEVPKEEAGLSGLLAFNDSSS